ncbi:cytidylate kinase family protein [Desulfobacter postgatei]|jgi:cytidylate kinase|uniref:cytidylate kinase family protein n=1 Tax=Desulfobacter postgatei TaxID=2293 RepID=UPI002A35E50D|nr:cytidylate kinase family protein [Desulfobacter postgatei]MDX9962167.1 cytidylate kinase family protein [Desulfobacter postgatei]
MSVITISRGSYSRGKEVAEKVASELGYECISRDILLEASEEFNIPEIRLIRALHDAPSVLERYTHGRDRYVSYIRKALLQHIRKDNVVYHGLAGHYFLPNLPHVLKIRIISDIEERVKEEVRRENISEEKARYILKKDDDERRKWGLRLYGIDTWDSKLYDMVIHIKSLSVEDAADLICATVRKPNFKTTPESEKILDDALLAAKVHAAIIKLSPTSIVTAHDGVVTIGDPEASMKNQITEVAENIEGVKKIIVNAHRKTDDQNVINPFHNI